MMSSGRFQNCVGLLLVLSAAGCASAAPFSAPSPGLDMMRQEEAYFYARPSDAATALGGNSLRARIDNTIAVYEAELARAQAAQGGFLNGTLNVLGFLLPISGTATSLALSDPDQVQTVAVVAGAATTAILGINLLLKPGAKAAAAAQCEAFLASAIDSFVERWGRGPGTTAGTEAEWNTYLTMRATLKPGRLSACGD